MKSDDNLNYLIKLSILIVAVLAIGNLLLKGFTQGNTVFEQETQQQLDY